jgi:hypothetical protein
MDSQVVMLKKMLQQDSLLQKARNLLQNLKKKSLSKIFHFSLKPYKIPGNSGDFIIFVVVSFL